MAWARPLCCKLSALGFFSDYIDPCSGLPMVHQDSNQVRGFHNQSNADAC